MSGRADTPTPEFVGNSRVRGARSPPGTPRDLTTPSRAHLGPATGHTDLPADFARAKWRSVPSAGLLYGKAEKRLPPGLHQSEVGKSSARVDFSRAKRRSVPPAGLLHGKAKKRRPPGLHQSKVGKSCARVDFSRAKRRSVPPVGLSQSKVGKCARRRFRAAGRCARPGGEKPPARRKKNRVFFRPLRACIRKRGLLFRKKNR